MEELTNINTKNTQQMRELEENCIEKYEAPPKKSYRGKPYNKYQNMQQVSCKKCGDIFDIRAFILASGEKVNYCNKCFQQALMKVKDN